jgi:cell division protein FtsN
MRFEIKSGGVVAILFGVAGLSFAVFLFGLLAGYDVGRESQSSSAQVATAYPVEPPPAEASAASPEAAPSPAVAAAPAPAQPPPVAADDESAPPVAPVAAAKPVRTKHAKPAHSSAAAVASSDRITETDASSPAGGMGSPPDASDEDDATSAADSESPSAAAPRPAPPAPHAATAAYAHPAPRHKPYTIQIQAAMDRNGASEMVQRLQVLGFQSRMVPTELNGQTWYRVVIGPFATQEAAAAAQQEMRAKYNSTYSGGGAGSRRSSGSD